MAKDRSLDARNRTCRISRRQFMQTTAGTAGLVALGGAASLYAKNDHLPNPKKSGIDHIVVVMMENRSFDHMLGWLPNADGRQAGLTYLDANGVAHPTARLADFQGCAHPDPDHSYDGGRAEFNGGACDGWLLAGQNDDYAIGYYTAEDLAFYRQAAPQWTVCDRYFAPIMAPTFPNRLYLHSGQTDRLENSFATGTLPTIWDRLADEGVEGRYYFSDVPLVVLWGSKYLPITRQISSFFADCAAGTLPAVSFVEPRFLEESAGLSNDDHPHADVRDGQDFQNSIYAAVTSSPVWRNTLLVFVYDEWGGFFDHVAPARAPIPPADQIAGNEDGRRGFRVPCILVSPFARRGHVSHITFDHTSILQCIEWRWKLEPLTVRDDTANNLAEALDFDTRNDAAPLYTVPPGPFGQLCPPSALNEWLTMRDLANVYRFPAAP